MRLLYLLIWFCLANSVQATTWVKDQVDDPIVEGKKCTVHQPASSGSYIYRWPSKYDQVFWPFTDANGIWHCKDSGFTAFLGDFEELTKNEITQIRDYLNRNPVKDNSLATQLFLLEAIYEIRKTDSVFDNKLLRILARWYQSMQQFEKANDYRQLAFKAIENSLKTDLIKYKELEYLYLAVNYSKQLGYADKTTQYFARLEKTLNEIEDEKLQGYVDYIKTLMLDSHHIVKGGVLDPDVPNSK